MPRRHPLSIKWLLSALVAVSCGGEPAGPPLPVVPVASSVGVLSGAGQATLPGLLLPQSIVIQVLDQNGLPFSTATVRSEASNGGEALQDRTTTGLDGRITIQWRLGDRIGPQRLEVSVDRLDGSLDISAEGAEMNPVDFVRVNNAPNGSYGVLASGTTAFGNVFDFRRTTVLTETAAGDFRALVGSGRSELAFFTPDAAPRVVLNPWTNGPDVVETSLAESVSVPITVWIMRGPFDDTRARVERDIDYTEDIYATEGLGLVFDVEIVDATATAGINGLMAFDCSKSFTTEQTVGHRDDRLNFYYVTTVDGGSQRGVTCPIGGNFVAMAGAAGRDLLSHEIGHMLGLRHIDSQAGFGTTNVMHSASSVRRFLTEGQIFRAHWDTRSALNGTLDQHPVELLRACLSQFDPTACPPVDSRLFDDGGIVAVSSQSPSPDAHWSVPALSRLDQALLRRCNTGEAADIEVGHDPDVLLEVFRRGPVGRLRSLVAADVEPAQLESHHRAIREEALRLLVLSRDARAGSALDEALSEDPEGFGGVVRWGRGFLAGSRPTP